MDDVDSKSAQLVIINAAIIVLSLDQGEVSAADEYVDDARACLLSAREQLTSKEIPESPRATTQQIRDFVEFHQINQRATGWL